QVQGSPLRVEGMSCEEPRSALQPIVAWGNFEKSKTGTGYPPKHSHSPHGVNRPMSKQNAIFNNDERDDQTMYSLGKPNVSDDWHLCVNINGVDLNMGIDTGALQSVISR